MLINRILEENTIMWCRYVDSCIIVCNWIEFNHYVIWGRNVQAVFRTGIQGVVIYLNSIWAGNFDTTTRWGCKCVISDEIAIRSIDVQPKIIATGYCISINQIISRSWF